MEEDLSMENHRNLKKKGKVTIDPHEKLSTGKKSGFNGSKKVNVGLSVRKLLTSQAYDPKNHNSLKDHNKASNSYDSDQLREAQASKETVSNFSKTPSATHGLCHIIGENIQTLNLGITESFCHLISNSQASCDGDHVKVDTPTSVQKQAQPVVHFNPTFEENSFVNVAVKERVLEAKNHSAMVFKRSSILEPISEETRGSNVSSCASDKFFRAFHEYNNQYKPDIICLLEPRISGVKADTIIAKLGWDKSHRVEAVGFSGDKAPVHDLGFQGTPFTWHRGNLSERLDRAVENDAWMEAFPNCLITHLTRIKSDHRPLFLKFCNDGSCAPNCPFQFLANWLHHQNFSDFVKNKWSYNGNMTSTVEEFTDKLKKWNKCVYGHISQRKRQLMHKLAKIKHVLDLSGTNSFFQQEVIVRDELGNIFHHEEML
ncbi:hypothetical protein PVK06_040471 [Gossypium arboreum]|uniref:Reverse transcriptase n=1 Tax=Gossypium arboreum TaxID=29729 RepID=A0ABR0N7P6_GOSAR|nr:hypothetical protein PVK06_040471 [Gossypium arboreum]